MGLLAIVVAQARKIGLFPRFLKALPIISFLCLISGFGWLFFLPQPGQYRVTYFSENALLAHQAITFFRETEWNVVRGIRGQLQEFHEQGIPEVQRNVEISKMFEEFGLRPAVHNWESSNSSGQNLYAIQHAPRGPHNEAIVIAAPWLGTHGEFNEGGVALLLALARFFKRWNFWSKNLIFALPSDSKVALRDWVDAYHTSLQYTAGSIEGALVLNYEFSGDFFDHVEIGFEGLNGELPNLDLINTAIHSVASEFAECTILGGYHPDTYWGRLESMAKHIWQQASGGMGDTAGSAMFSGWRISAITLDAIQGNENYDITTLGRVCESTARSINNLMEHFHQSFFFYLMLGVHYFVSIASYLPAAMLVAGSFSVMAFSELTKLVSAAPETAATKSTKIARVNAADWALAGGAVIVTAVTSSFMGHFIASPHLANVGLGSLFVVVNSLASKQTVAFRQIMYAMALFLLGLQLTTLAMVNFSLAMILGAVSAPLAWISPQRSEVSEKSLRSLVLGVAACPLLVLAAVAHFAHNSSYLPFVTELVENYRELGAMNWLLIMSTWVPAWIVTVSCI